MVKQGTQELPNMPERTALEKTADFLLTEYLRLRDQKAKVVTVKDKLLEEMKKLKKFELKVKGPDGEQFVIEYKESSEGVSIKKAPVKE